MGSAALPSSFRDPSGFLFSRDGVLYRQVNRSFTEQYDRLMSSGLYDTLTGEGLLVPHEEVDVAPAAEGAYRILRPERLPFISYPYEWTFSQYKDAALATLRIQDVALDHGMSLRDASAYNIQFRDGRAVLIDTLSFEPLPEGRPWVAYRQFCQHFLAPLALMASRDVRLGQLMRVHIDGIPLDLTSALLPRRTRLRPALAMHIHLQARVERRSAGKPVPEPTGNRSFSLQAFRGVIDNLRSAIRRLDWQPGGSTWQAYYQECDHYTAEAFELKRSLVGKFLDDVGPSTVWDLGANVGVFSRLASERGISTVAFEFDVGCVEANYRKIVAEGERNLLPLVCDLTNPAPSLGWAHRERSSLAERGPADCVMALALIHHLAIANNVPLPLLASFFAEIARTLVIEFVPKGDPKVDVLLSTREDIFTEYHRDGFERAFAEPFDIERAEPILGTDRVLYLMKKK